MRRGLYKTGLIIIFFFSILTYGKVFLYGFSSEGEIFSNGERRFYSGNYSGALEYYAALIKKYPLSDLVPDAMYRKALCLLMLNRLEESKENFIAVEKRYKNTSYIAYVPFWMGSIDFRLGNFSEAVEYFTSFLSQPAVEKEFVEKTYLYMAVSCFRLGNLERAYESIKSLLSSKKIENLTSKEIIILFTILVASKKFEDVIEIYSHLEPNRYSEDTRMRVSVLVAEAFLRKGYVREAEKIYRTLLEVKDREIAEIVFSRLLAIYKKAGMYRQIIAITRYADSSLDLTSEVLRQVYLQSGIIGYRLGDIKLSLYYLQKLWNYINSSMQTPERWLVEPLGIFLSEDYLKLNKKQKAVEVLTKLLSFYPDSKFATYSINTIYILDGDFKKAVSVFKSYLATFQHDNIARFYLCISLYKIGEITEAEKEGLKVKSVDLPVNLRADYYHLMGLISSKLGKMKDAVKYYEQYMLIRPNDKRIFLDYLKTLFQISKYKDIIKKTEGRFDLKSGNPLDVEIGYLRALSLIMFKDYNDALVLLQEVIKNSKTYSIEELSGYSMYYLGWCLFKLDRMDEAQEIFEKFISSYPYHPLYISSLYLAAWSSYNLGNFSNSEKLFKKLSQMESQYKQIALYLMSKSLINQEKYQDAIPVLKKLYTEYPEYELSDDAMFDYATILDRLGKPKEAAEVYYTIYKKSPEKGIAKEALYKRAEIYYRLGDYKRAEEGFGEFASLFPNDKLLDAAIYWRTQSLLKLSNNKKAIELLQMLIEDFPRSSFRPDALIDLAEMKANFKNYGEAIALYSKLIDEYPEYKDDVDIKIRVEELRYLEFGLSPDEANLTAKMSVFRGVETRDGREAMLSLSKLYLKRGGQYLERAFEFLNRVLEQKDRKTAAEAQYLIGEYYSKKGNVLSAARAYFRASLIYTEDREFVARALYKSGEKMLEAGREKEARDILDRVVEKFPDLAWAEKARKLLEGK